MSIGELVNKYRDERIVIVGNGPSLTPSQLEMISKEYSIGINKINDIYDETSWRPSFYILSKSIISNDLKQYVKENIKLGIDCFINDELKNVFGCQDNIYYFSKHSLSKNPKNPNSPFNDIPLDELRKAPLKDLYRYWSSDASEVVYSHHTMYAAFQILMYLGFKEWILIGCDLGFERIDPHMVFDNDIDPLDYDSTLQYLTDARSNDVFIQSLINLLLFNIYRSQFVSFVEWVSKNNITDENHFKQNYIARPWCPNGLNSELRRGHIVANRIGNDNGVTIVNATDGGHLEIYPRDELENVVSR